MKRVETGIEGLVVIEPQVFGDERGFFMETYNERMFRELGLPLEWKQDNHSRSARGVLRGLHFQSPKAQGKLVRVVQGAVWDVAVDLRPNSPTFGRWYGLELSVENKKMFYVPPEFAHGFCVLTEVADFCYKCTELYSPQDEGGIRWDDPDLAIAWPLENPQLSSKDLQWKSFADFRKSHQ